MSQPTSLASAEFISEAEYLAREKDAPFKSEYFNGQIFAMAGGSPTHARLGITIGRACEAALEKGPCNAFNSELKVRTPGSGLYTYPDVTIVCGELEYADSDRSVITNPVVIFEVLSESTEAYDRGEKFNHYKSIKTLQAYVLVSQWEPRVEVLSRKPTGTGWDYDDANGLESLIAIPPLQITLKLADIYNKVELSPRPVRVHKAAAKS